MANIFQELGVLITGSRCPQCNSPMKYDGVYWCAHPQCGYVIPDTRLSKADKNAFNVAYTLLMQQTDQEPNPDHLYKEVL